MTVLLLSGEPVNWAKPPAPTRRVMWSQKTSGGKIVQGSFRTIAWLDYVNTLAIKKFGRGIVVIQSAYNKGVADSSGTHDYDACLDVYIPGVPWPEQRSFFRANGAGAYWRYPPAFGDHIHLFVLPPHEGQDVSDDYRVAGFTVGYYVDGGWSLYGKRTTSSQIEDYYNHRSALAGHYADVNPDGSSTWFPSNIEATIFDLPAYIRKQQGAAKPPKQVLTIPQKAIATVLAFIIAAVAPVVAASQGGSSHNGKPVPAQQASQTITAVVWNEKSFPPMPVKNYVSDFNRGFALGGARTVWMNQEISYQPQVRIFHQTVRRLGYDSRGSHAKGGPGRDGDTVLTFKGFPKVKAIKIQISEQAPGPASPARWLTVAAQQDMPVVYLSLHLTNGCFKKNIHKSWYAARCKFLDNQISLVRKIVAKFRVAGSAVIVGGDMNRHKRIIWGPGQQSAYGPQLMQLSGFSSKFVKVKVRAGRLIRGLHTDHPLLMALIAMRVVKEKN